MNIFRDTCYECEGRKAVVEVLQAQLDEFKDLEAQRLTTQNRFSEAAVILRGLKSRRDAEKNLAAASGDTARAAAAEMKSLKTHQDLAHVLARLGNFDEAEPMMKQALARRAELRSTNSLAFQSAHSDLCLILTSQNSPPKYREAESLHRVEWDRHEDVALGEGLSAERLWIVKNGNLLAMLLHRKGMDDDAISVLRRVLAYCAGPSRETNEVISNFVTYLLDSARRDEELRQPWAAASKLDEATRILQDWFLRPNLHLDRDTLDFVINIVRIIDQREANALAETNRALRRQIYDQYARLRGPASTQAFNAGWSLANWLRANDRAEDAKVLVKDLLRAQEAQFEQSDAVRSLRGFLGQPVGERASQMDRGQGHSSRSHRSGGQPLSRQNTREGSNQGSQISPGIHHAVLWFSGAPRQ